MIRSVSGKTETLKKDRKPAGQRLGISAPSDFRIIQQGADTASQMLAGAVDIKPSGFGLTPQVPLVQVQNEAPTPGDRVGEWLIRMQRFECGNTASNMHRRYDFRTHSSHGFFT